MTHCHMYKLTIFPGNSFSCMPTQSCILHMHGQGTSGPDQCPLFGVERSPLFGGSKCISYVVKPIRDKWAVRCREVFRFSEGPLLEVLLNAPLGGKLKVDYLHISHNILSSTSKSNCSPKTNFIALKENIPKKI